MRFPRYELPLLRDLAILNQCKKIVEIGVLAGDGTEQLCQAAVQTGGHVWGFDLWEIHGLRNQFRMPWSKQKVVERLTNAGIPSEAYTLTKIDTRQNVDQFKTILQEQCAPIDFCFIDGCHSYIGISNDFFAVYPFLSECGIIMFHDTLAIDGCREFMVDLRSKFWDGTYDIVDFPHGGGRRRVGISLLVKRCYHKINRQMDEVCNLDDRRNEILQKESDWYNAQIRHD